MAVPEVERGVAREAVQIAPALHVGDPGTLTGADDDRQGTVVVRRPALGELDVLGRAQPVLRHVAMLAPTGWSSETQRAPYLTAAVETGHT